MKNLTRNYKYLISTLLVVAFSLATSAQDLTKAVWAYHNGASTPYATFGNLHDALDCNLNAYQHSEGDRTNPDLATNDILELHNDVSEPDGRGSYSVGGINYYYPLRIQKNLTIRSESEHKYTVSGPASASAINYYFLCYGNSEVNLTIENVEFALGQYPGKPTFITFYGSSSGDITLENVDIVSGKSMYGSSGCQFYFKDCYFKDMDGVIECSANRALEMDGCTIDNCCASAGSNYLSGAISLTGATNVVLNNLTFRNNKLCILTSGSATCTSTIDGSSTLFTQNEQVLHVQGGVCTINNGTFTNNANPGTSSYDEENTVFRVGDSPQAGTLVINGGTFTGNSTLERSTGSGYSERIIGNAVFSVGERGVLKLHGGSFTNNNTGSGRYGEVVSLDRGTTNYTESSYGKVAVSGAPVFAAGQYIYLEKWHKTTNGDWLEGIQHIYKDGAFSPTAKINVSMRMGAGFINEHTLDILVSDGSAVLESDLAVLNNPYTDIYLATDPVTDTMRFNATGGDSDNGPVIEFAPVNMTTIQITRYDLQEGDNAIFCIYQETSSGVWTKIHSIPLKGKATGGYVTRTLTVSSTSGNLKIVETDFNYKYAKTGTKINGVACADQGVGYASTSANGNLITFEVHGEKTLHAGTENSKNNIFIRRRANR